jgi:HEAT repeat protein
MSWFLLGLLLVAQAEDEPKSKVEKLIAELKKDNNPFAWTSAQELGSMRMEAKEAIPALRQALKAKSADTRGHAAAALLLIDPAEAGRAFPVLFEVFKDREQGLVHMTLLEPLGQRLEPSTKEITAGLLQLAGEDVVWGWVIADMALKRVEKDNKQAVVALESALKDPKLTVRVQAARYLGRLDPARRTDLVPVLREGLKQPDVEMRILAADDLVRLDPSQRKPVIDTLTPDLRDKNNNTRIRTALFLLELDADQVEQVLPVLSAGVKSASGTDVLRKLGESLKRKSDRVTLVQPLLEQGLKADDPAIRKEAIRQVGALGPHGQALEKQIRDATGASRVDVATTAIEALMRLRPEKGAERINQLIEMAEKRDRAAQGVGKMLELVEKIKLLTPPDREDEWVLSLAEQIDRRQKRDPNGWHREELMRLHAIIELGNLSTRGVKGVQALVRVLRDRGSANEITRGQAAVALGRMGKEAREAIPLLNRIARDETEALDVRAIARAAVVKIDRDKDK